MTKEPPSSEEDVIRQLEEQERLAVLNEDLAALEHLWVERRFTNIWRKHGTEWHLIARHANVIHEIH